MPKETYRKRRQKTYGKRPKGENWYGTPSDKRSILEAAYESMDKTGKIDKEKFANMLMGFPGGVRGGYTELRKITVQHKKEGMPKK